MVHASSSVAMCTAMWHSDITFICVTVNYVNYKRNWGGGEIAQSLASLSVKQAIRVRARLDPLVTERWNSITVLFTRSH